VEVRVVTPRHGDAFVLRALRVVRFARNPIVIHQPVFINQTEKM